MALQALTTRAYSRVEITNHWDEAKQSFLLIGETLYLAKEKLQHGEFEEMIWHDLPFERTVCHQLRRVQRGCGDKPTSGRGVACRLQHRL